MDNTPKRKWHQKKRLVIPLGVGIFVVALASIGNSNTQNVTVVQQQTAVQSATVSATPAVSAPTTNTDIVPTTPSSGLSNDNYYNNSDDNEVHSPAYSENNAVPAGATAECSDGTYSFSQHHSGTCSHHGGVAEWLN